MRNLFVVLILGIVACGGDAKPSDADVGGVWTATYTNMSGSGITCNSTNHPLTLVMTGSTFTGHYGPFTLHCTSGTESFDSQAQGTVVNGSTNLNSVAFDLDTQDFHQTGTVSGNSMSGTAQWNVDLGSNQNLTLNGSWSAAKQ
jgi:hypothetical protein